MAVEELERISEAPWNGAAGRFTDEQWASSCALDRKSCGSEWADKSAKARCLLPYKEPSGEISRAGTHDAAERIAQVTGVPAGELASAKSTLREAYKSLGEDPPASLNESEAKPEEDLGWARSLETEFGVTPGQARHGEVALRWDVAEDAVPMLREQPADSSYIGTLHGHFCVFNRWTEIRSFMEGNFMERIAPGACKKTFQENRDGMRCLLNHGRDPQFGMKPLGPISELEEDKVGGRYEVPLLDTVLNRDLLPALKEVPSLYGASFRFEVMREEVETNPKRANHNPKGIEERTITEMRVREFGPVTFPAYPDASAGARSLNDWWAHLDLEAFRGAHPEAFPMSLAQILHVMNLRGSADLSGTRTSSSAEKDPERAEWEASHEAAPSSGAPGTSKDGDQEQDPESANRGMQPTRLTGAARRPLRSQRKEEEPQWKL